METQTTNCILSGEVVKAMENTDSTDYADFVQISSTSSTYVWL